jgi:hypothetical protein
LEKEVPCRVMDIVTFKNNSPGPDPLRVQSSLTTVICGDLLYSIELQIVARPRVLKGASQRAEAEAGSSSKPATGSQLRRRSSSRKS